ncbi:MAG: ribosomal RNA small subunit methyltransferase A [Pseudoalteromonas sp.]|uniref:16S rRNA (adenine(1518)-N(6)/adenine(1519)-N(6))- dimethyltransferase RsmA n=1 Tax=Pseudoalteromonas sp. TaxID=53249 RepID=UPI001D75D2FA|nr:16S rRNA (adenine(1518)-N(6)/adenine(1519)-N(6))-dimethyltransferase RsmA [Pseudoalteromonas sp.]NRA80831.1 ribosomal RNA small subunit methyltransferase A [Pseudoalteromonas sp.]
MTDKVHLGHRARKRFGQNFLNDDMIIDKIVTAIDPKPEDNLVEIGPGLGAITEPVADAMKFDFSSLIKSDEKLKIFGNLPYNVSTPLLFHLFEFADNVEHMHFMLQKEVVKRMVAGPGSKAFGRLSVMTQYYCHAMPVIDVPPECFKPAPKVDSAVIRLIPKKPEQRSAKSTKLLNTVCLEAFNQRRKTLRNSLSNLLTAEELTSIGIDITLRAESLSLQQFIDIANWIYDNKQ